MKDDLYDDVELFPFLRAKSSSSAQLDKTSTGTTSILMKLLQKLPMLMVFTPMLRLIS
jgi:hypothetical protein